MAVDVRIAGKLKFNAISYSMVEDATSVDPSDMTGGVGQLTVELDREPNSKSYFKKFVDIEDSAHGTSQGYVSAISGNSYSVTLTINSRLVATAVTRTAQPYNGNLDGAIRYYLSLVGLTNSIVINENIANRTVIVGGWTDNVWDVLKRLCTAEQVEIALISDNIVVRKIRERVGVIYRSDEPVWSIGTEEIAQSVEILYYNNTTSTKKCAYPVGGYFGQGETINVEAGEVLEMILPLDPGLGNTGAGSSLTSVEQPTVVSYVTPEDFSDSVYTVMDSENKMIEPWRWSKGGGRIIATLEKDAEAIKLTVIGARGVANGPFRIACKTPGLDDPYNSLRLVGAGTFYNKKKLTLYTGNKVDVAPTVVGVTVDNPFINTKSDAMIMGSWTVAKYTGPSQSVSVTSMGVNRFGARDSYRYPTIKDFNTDYANKTFKQFNTEWAGKTIKEFNAVQVAKVSNDFDNQTFGNLGGARIFYDFAWYRIRTGTTTPGGVNYTMELDTTVKDFNTNYSGLTFAEFNTLFAGQKIADFNSSPMREV